MQPNLETSNNNSQISQKIRIWDMPTRLFHWLIAALITALVITGKIGGDAMNWHFLMGYAILTLIIFRIIWGFCGGHHSRFLNFVPTPKRIKTYLKGNAIEKEKASAGHNPIGAFSVFAMISIIALQVSSGLFTDDEIVYAGPMVARASSDLIEIATNWHKVWGQYILLGFIALHILAIIIYRIKGKNLVSAMIFGDKIMNSKTNIPASKDNIKTKILALILISIISSAVYHFIKWANSASLY